MSSDGGWHNVQATLSYSSFTQPEISISWIQSGTFSESGLSSPPISSFQAFVTDMVISRADGTVLTIYGDTNSTSTMPTCTGGSGGYASVQPTWDQNPFVAVQYNVGDDLGTAQLRLNASGVPVWRGEFLPFGGELDTNPTTNNYKFTGKERDAESGLDYFGPRYYGNNMGRFMSPDNFGGHLEDPQTLNKYAYAGNNPLRYTDPSGHDFWQSCNEVGKTCGNQNIGTGTDGKPINQLVSGTTDANGKFTATVITSASLGKLAAEILQTSMAPVCISLPERGRIASKPVRVSSSPKHRPQISRALELVGISSTSISTATM